MEISKHKQATIVYYKYNKQHISYFHFQFENIEKLNSHILKVLKRHQDQTNKAQKHENHCTEVDLQELLYQPMDYSSSIVTVTSLPVH